MVNWGDGWRCNACLLEEALSETREKWNFNTLLYVGQRLLDEVYPADIPLIASADSPDPGPRLAAAVRDCLAVIKARAAPPPSQDNAAASDIPTEAS